MTARLADPYRDLMVIDARAPRFNQAVVALVAITTVATGWWPLVGLMGAQLAIGVVFGRKYCLPCLFYFEVVQPRFGEGPLEDSRSPRFANIIGAVFLLSSAATWALGFAAVGQGLAATVAVLATLATTTGLCVGCELYRVIARLRGVRGGAFERFDLEQLGVAAPAPFVVLFTHPLCHDCQTIGPKLEAAGHAVVQVDVSQRRELAKKYGVQVVPLAFQVAADGRVMDRLS